MIQYFPIVTGSLTVLGNISVSGSITTSGSITISGSITSASFASTASYWSGSIVNAESASFASTSSFVALAQSASYVLNAVSSSFATSASYWSGSIVNAESASFASTSSFVALAQSASNAVAAATASFANAFTVAGNLTAQTLVVQTITSSVDFVTGSTRFGSILGNTHVFSGSVTMNPGGLFISSSGLVGIGTITPSTLLQVTTARTNGTNVNVLTLSDTTTGVQTVGFGARIQYLSNTTSVQAAIGLEQGGSGTNNESQISFYTQNTAGALTKQLTIGSTGAATFSNSITATDGTFSSSGVDGSLGSVVRISTTNTNGNARNWAIVNTFDSYGDLNFRLSTAQGGNALVSGSTILTLSRTGAATLNGPLQVTTTSNNGIAITTNDIATLKMSSSGGSTKNWGFATTNLAASDFGIYQSTSNGGDPISAGTAKLYFTSGGNVLIGTTTDNAYKLNVSGKIFASSIVTSGNTVIINSSTPTVLNSIASGITVIRDQSYGGGCLVFYEYTQTPIIIAQAGATVFTTGSPSATQIQIADVGGGSGGITAKGGSSRNNVQLGVGTFNNS